MPKLHIIRENQIQPTARVAQLSGLFDLPQEQKTRKEWSVDLPIEQHPWQIGLIVGSSGSGKSTIARELFGGNIDPVYDWPADKAVVDGFPAKLGIKEVTELLSSVGFSSPPAWLVPFRCLSNGQQFRASMARLLAEQREGIAVCDEFTSVVDRTVAQVASVAIARTVRKRQQQFVAVSCHSDIIDWLDPDWLYDVDQQRFTWRLERRSRPEVQLQIYRGHHSAWPLFHAHHYLSGELHTSSKVFIADVSLDQGKSFRPAALCAVLPRVGKGSGWREHRLVCLPDFQGLGIGNRLSAFVGSVMTAEGKSFSSLTAHPGMIRHRHASRLWQTLRGPSHVSSGHNATSSYQDFAKTSSKTRLTASFRYIGPALDRAEAARLLEVRTDLAFPPETVLPALRLLSRFGQATADELAEASGIKPDTVRRWCQELAQCAQLKVSRSKPPVYQLGPRPIPGW